MPHAVIRINEQDRQLFDAIGVVIIYRKYVDALRTLFSKRVLIYQSVRYAKRSKLAVGYFAEASVQDILQIPGRAKTAVFLSEVMPVMSGLGEDATSLAFGIETGGWRAADDVREIADEMFSQISPRGRNMPFAPMETSVAEHLPIYRASFRPVRNPAFHKVVYLAYRGQCAICKSPFLSPSGLTGLEAAHIVPWAMSPHERASAGILLTPSWHRRFEMGIIIINDDFTWSAIVEDDETLAIRDRRLRLPANKADWPDISLLRQKREIVARQR
ncbi:HNH endonuclease [Devosia sp. BK]|uniref:HNH endonuclease n=1 Tax=Devosia sp. BK TaxID=2871706 RepID=UPI00293A135A|nr:HNH endonuclease [Devosia sp. BK]MDV3253609.1 HNH endonuclease [Devosia sp. BK]